MDDDLVPLEDAVPGDDKVETLLEEKVEPAPNLSLRDKANQVVVLNILGLMVNERLSAKEACQRLDVPLSTFYHWQKTGVTLAAYAELNARVAELAFEVILPGFKQMVETLASIAQGLPPDHNPRMKVDANHAIAAWREITRLIPIMPMDQAGAGTKAADHLAGYVPRQINPIPGGMGGATFTQINQFLFKGTTEASLAPEDWDIEAFSAPPPEPEL